MNSLKKMKSALVAEKLAKAIIVDEYKKIIGFKVRITKKYSKWLNNHFDEIYKNPDGAPSIESDLKFIKELIKKRPIGKVTSARYDTHDGVIVEVLFKDGRHSEILNLEDIEPAKD